MQADTATESRTSREALPDFTVAPRAMANMCFGLFGVQIVWGLQNVDTSRIFQTLGANLEELPILWIAGPITGLLVQPIIGHLSDRTWGPLGRRRPYLLGGAGLAAVALILMPNVRSLWAATLMLWLLTASINIAMEPFRALIADSVPEERRNSAYAMQVGFIGAGAVIASILPWLLTKAFGISNVALPGVVPPSVRIAFAIGALGLLVSVGTTVATTPERPPGHLAGEYGKVERFEWATNSFSSLIRHGALWTIAGVVLALATFLEGFRHELYLIAGLQVVLGAGQWATAWSARHGARPTGLLEVIDDVIHMPPVLRRLGLVQFFTWFGLFAMWIYAVPAIASLTRGGSNPASTAYNASADWAGVIFGVYNAVAAVGAFALPFMTVRIGRRETHALCLFIGAGGLLGLVRVSDQAWLWVPAVGIGVAWASILSIPYAMVASAVPPTRIGVYMGIHNVFLVLPQLVATAMLGWVVHTLLRDRADLALAVAAAALAISAGLALTIPDHDRA